MPAGQTPHTVALYAHNDLVDKVQPGDRVNVTGKIWFEYFHFSFSLILTVGKGTRWDALPGAEGVGHFFCKAIQLPSKSHDDWLKY